MSDFATPARGSAEEIDIRTTHGDEFNAPARFA